LWKNLGAIVSILIGLSQCFFLSLFLFFVFWYRISLSSPGWPWIVIFLPWLPRDGITGVYHHPWVYFVSKTESWPGTLFEAQVSLKLPIILPPCLEYWDYRCVPLWLSSELRGVLAVS
jgi:hypothetical protein